MYNVHEVQWNGALTLIFLNHSPFPPFITTSKPEFKYILYFEAIDFQNYRWCSSSVVDLREMERDIDD